MRFARAIIVVGALSGGALAQSGPESIDLVRIAEAYRLAEAVRDSVWPDWKAPFALLLVTEEAEFLTGTHEPPEGFAPLGHSAMLQRDVWSRPRQFDLNLLATFPAFGSSPVIVIGRTEATQKTSTSWVLTVCHEHFHQYQMSDPSYYAAVNQLDLAGDDRGGMWMLNYPFPYADGAVGARFAAIARQLAALLGDSSPARRERFWQEYRRFLGTLSEKDARYLRFQVWQEGVARYVELRVAEAAAAHYAPSIEFASLPDASAFSAAADSMRTRILAELAAPDLAAHRRSSFYAFGAGLALLLDRDDPLWKRKYFLEKFSVENYAHVR